MQDPTPDTNPATSEGIFVYTGSTPTVSLGDSVLVSGKVSDYYALSSGETLRARPTCRSPRSAADGDRRLDRQRAAGPDRASRPTTVPDTYAPDLGGGNIEDTPITPTRSALDYYESIEGMRVEVDDARVVGPSNQYGEQYVTTKPDQDRPTAAAPACPATTRPRPDAWRSRRSTARPSASTSATCCRAPRSARSTGRSSAATSSRPPPSAPRSTTTCRRSPRHAGTKKQLSIATYNVENLAPGDPTRSTRRSAQGVVTNLAIAGHRGAGGDPGQQRRHRRRHRRRRPDAGKLIARDQGGRRPDLRLPRDRPGQRQGRRPARRQHPRRVPVQPRRGSPSSTAAPLA